MGHAKVMAARPTLPDTLSTISAEAVDNVVGNLPAGQCTGTLIQASNNPKGNSNNENDSGDGGDSEGSSNVPLIVGAAAGGVAVLVLAFFTARYCCNKSPNETSPNEPPPTDPELVNKISTPV